MRVVGCRSSSPAFDVRRTKRSSVRTSGVPHSAIAMENSRELYEAVAGDTHVVAIEEVQFFDSGIIAVCQKLADRGYDVVAAGLDMDYRGRPFGPMPQLLAVADQIIKLRAICTVCGRKLLVPSASSTGPRHPSQRLPYSSVRGSL
jgi:thymidine kinase